MCSQLRMAAWGGQAGEDQKRRRRHGDPGRRWRRSRAREGQRKELEAAAVFRVSGEAATTASGWRRGERGWEGVDVGVESGGGIWRVIFLMDCLLIKCLKFF